MIHLPFRHCRHPRIVTRTVTAWHLEVRCTDCGHVWRKVALPGVQLTALDGGINRRYLENRLRREGKL